MTGLVLSRLGFALSAGLSIALTVSALVRIAPKSAHRLPQLPAPRWMPTSLGK
jgi:hypothetical protein